jgi:hypothetical protein
MVKLDRDIRTTPDEIEDRLLETTKRKARYCPSLIFLW